MYSLRVSCSSANSNKSHTPSQSNTMRNSLYMSNLSHKKLKAIAALDAQIYKTFQRNHQDKDELSIELNKLFNTIEVIHNINKKNNLYKLFDDKLIPID